VIEEYWGIWSAMRQTTSPWPVDSVIHALGGSRKVAREKLQYADYIISTKFWTSPEWQPWNLSQNFWFYDELFRQWIPWASSPTTVVWRRNDHQRIAETCQCRFERDERSLIMPPIEPGFYIVDMVYYCKESGRTLLLIQNNISHGSDAGGYVSIDPRGDSVRFPVYIPASERAKLNVKIVPYKETHNLGVASCRVSKILFDYNEVLHVPETADNAFFLTDQNWVNGIARRWAGFFVPNNKKFRGEYRPGRIVQFANLSTRRIVRTEMNGIYLNIFVEGDPLNPEEVGMPNSFSVLD
jgi:hypothetical protein